MLFVYILIVFLILGLGVFFVSEISLKRKKDTVLGILKKQGTLEVSPDKAFDYVFTHNKTDYKLKLIHIGNHKELSINSKKHWQVKPSNKLKMIATNGFEALDEPKILFVDPSPLKMVKYLNENEIVFIEPNEKCFDFYVYTEKTIKEINLS